jgi:hypothetical protein
VCQRFMSEKLTVDKLDLIANTLGIKTEMGIELTKVAVECLQLFDTKQMDYGSSNISSSGELGISVRLQDKVSRMRHIQINDLKGNHNVNHEALEDTYIDSANYSMIGVLLKRGLWK